MKIDKWRSRLVMLKNTAYAWRQMVFFLSLLPEDEVAEFLRAASAHLEAQPTEFADRFRPALEELIISASGQSIYDKALQRSDARCFLGWSKERHWLLP